MDLSTGWSSGLGSSQAELLADAEEGAALVLRRYPAFARRALAHDGLPVGEAPCHERLHHRAQGGGRILQVSSAGGGTTYPNFSLYHATKWGVEGFMETVAKDVAPFGIGVTIVEPGATRTNFGGGMVSPPPLVAYEHIPAGDVRRAFASGAFPIDGDADKVARAMIDSADHEPAPLRLALGRDACTDVRKSLVGRLAALDAQKAVALSTVTDG